MNRSISKVIAVAGLVSLGSLTPSLASDTFLKSDDHDDELVGRFLTDTDYALMVDDLERNDAEFDWGWVATESGKPKKTKQLAFRLSDYHTVAIPPVQDFSSSLSPDLAEKVRGDFEQAVKALGLQLVPPDTTAADLELGIAIIDLKREKTYAYVAMIDPYIKLEVRLRDRAAGKNLLLLRNRAHSETPEDAALRYAGELVKFLR
jgi:hypothetical protein